MKPVVIAVLLALTLAMFLTFNGLFFASPEQCPICSHAFSHAPCLLNISTGKINTLDVYDYSTYDYKTPAEFQRSGFAVIMNYGDATGIRMTDPWYVKMSIRAKQARVPLTTYCQSCYGKLLDQECGFVALDLGNCGSPVIYEIKDNNTFSFRCYDAVVKQVQDYFILTVYGSLALTKAII